jgi:hypothetical protein
MAGEKTKRQIRNRDDADFDSAARLIESLIKRPEFKHHFWREDFSPGRHLRHGNFDVRGHKQINDLYLAEIAAGKGSRFATLDKRIQHPALEVISS